MERGERREYSIAKQRGSVGEEGKGGGEVAIKGDGNKVLVTLNRKPTPKTGDRTDATPGKIIVTGNCGYKMGVFR